MVINATPAANSPNTPTNTVAPIHNHVSPDNAITCF